MEGAQGSNDGGLTNYSARYWHELKKVKQKEQR